MRIDASVPRLPPEIAGKLSKIAGLLSSDHDGEIAAAGRAGTRLLRQAGLTWADVFAPEAPSRPEARPAGPPPSAHAGVAAWALRFPERLTPWECRFLRDVGRRQRLTPKQAAVFRDILDRLRAGGAA